MRFFRFLCFCACAALPLIGSARPAEPVTVTLNESSTVGTSVVTVGDVALITGGDAPTRARVARIDLAELKSRTPSTAIGRKTVEYRLVLAGFDADAVRVTGAERANVALTRRVVSIEEVTAVARTEVLRQYPNPESLVVELAVPVTVKLPEVPADERVTITAKRHGKPGAMGRAQMDMAVAVGGETLMSFAVHLNVQPAAPPAVPTVAQAGALSPLPPLPVPPVPAVPVPTLSPPPGVPATAATAPPAGTAFASGEILIRQRQRVEMQVNGNGLKVTAVGEAQQAGKLGQVILVQNVDSKKVISARVTGPGTVEVDLGGSK